MQRAVHGEAIPIAVPDFGTVYFLKRGADAPSMDNFGDFPLFCPRASGGTDVYSAIRSLGNFEGPCEARNFHPIIARVQTDRPMVEEISTAWANEPDCTVICVQSVQASATDEPLTSGLTDILPWLKISTGPGNEIGTSKDPLFFGLARPPYFRQDFSTEF